MNNSDPSMNPDGGDGVWRADRKPALDNLMARILERVSRTTLSDRNPALFDRSQWRLKRRPAEA